MQNGTLVAVEFKGKPYYRPLGIIYKTGRVFSPAMKRFLKTLKESPDPADALLISEPSLGREKGVP